MEFCNNTMQIQGHLLESFLKGDEDVVDATLGNGKDTYALSSMTTGQIHAFDIQQKAIDNAESFLKEKGVDMSRIRLHCADHSRMKEYISNPVSLVLFNLGYLPGGDKTITTTGASSLSALRSALELIVPRGLVLVTVYSGHPEGAEEQRILHDWIKKLDQKRYNAVYVGFPNQSGAPPELFCIEKRIG